MLFETVDLVYVLLPLVGCLLVLSLVLRWRLKARERNPVLRALKMLKITTLANATDEAR